MNEALKAIKSTLRLPSSKFPPRPPPDAIARYVRQCDDLYAWQLRERPASSYETFTLHDGPPYANGDLHVGHALNKITKDIICRTKLAEGKRINYVPGWDCHGLPIELKAFEKHGWERGSGVNPVKIRGAARGFAAKAVEKQMKGFRSWGIMADWDNHWKTMDKDFELRQLAVFKAMAEHGLIIRRHKPVYWSPSSQTALAEAEIERDEHTSTAAIVKFRIPAVIAESTEPVHAVIWTTTPWTLPANQAIAIHKDLKYLLVRSKKHGNLIVAYSRLMYLSEQLEEEVEVLKVLESEELLQCTYSGLSQFGEDSLNRPIIHADFVSADDGTGLVHCAPGHGGDDFEALQGLIKSGRVVVKTPVNDKGEFTEAASPAQPSLLAGKYVFKEGNKAVLDLLRSENALISSYDFKHKYPIDWRTKQPIIIRATAQWFADISKIKDEVIRSLDSVDFRPESGRSRLKSFVENRSEWCISRQRSWGVPIPAIYHKETHEAVLNGQSIDHIIGVIKERGIDCWWSDPSDDPAWIMPGLAAEEYVRGKDTMDVWFDSGTSWSLISELNGQPPQAGPLADVYFEGSDQHRGWFQSSILTNIAYQKATQASASAQSHAPFKQLVTHGFTLDAAGKKMSKSIGNVVSPDEIIAGRVPQPAKSSKKGRILHPLGPDALRLWAATGDWTSDVVVSDKVITNVHKSLDKYRVTMKVLLGMLADFDADLIVPYNQIKTEKFEVHQLALFQLYRVVGEVREAMQKYEFHKALAAINEWVARDLSAFYLESVKDAIYCSDPNYFDRCASQTVLYHIFYQFQHMLAPIIPLLIEETYEFTPEAIKNEAGHPLKRVWRPLPVEWNDLELASKIPGIMAINSAVKAAQEQARAGKLLGQSLACEVAVIFKENGPLLQLSQMFWNDFLVVSNGVCNVMGDKSPAIEAFKEFSKAHTEEERAVVRAASVMHMNEYASAIAGPPTGKQGWTYCWEVDDPARKGEIMAIVFVFESTKEKCMRCWKYIADKPEQEEKPPLCSRCDQVMSGKPPEPQEQPSMFGRVKDFLNLLR